MVININFQSFIVYYSYSVLYISLKRIFYSDWFFLTVREDTLSDMVAHMTESVGLVHQMPFSCDRSGLPATLEKVCIYLL